MISHSRRGEINIALHRIAQQQNKAVIYRFHKEAKPSGRVELPAIHNNHRRHAPTDRYERPGRVSHQRRVHVEPKAKILPAIEARPRSPNEYGLYSANKLGEGAFGVVYQVSSPTSGRKLAVKRVVFGQQNHSLEKQRKVKTKALKEAKILKALDHPHIVKQENCKLYRKSVRIVMELINGSD